MFFFAITGSVSTQIQNQNLRPSLFVGYILHDNTAAKANDKKKRKQESTNTFLLLPLFSALCHIHTYSHLSSLLSVMWHGSGLKECSNKKTKPNMDSFWSSAVTNNSISSVWLSNKLNINLLCGM